MWTQSSSSPARGRSGYRSRSRSPDQFHAWALLDIPATTAPPSELVLAFASAILDSGCNQVDGKWFVMSRPDRQLLISTQAAARYVSSGGFLRTNAAKVCEMLTAYLGGIGARSQTPTHTLAELNTWFGLEPTDGKSNDTEKLSKEFVVVGATVVCDILRQMMSQEPMYIRRGIKFRFNTKPFLPTASDTPMQGVRWTADRVRQDAEATYVIASVLRASAGLEPNPPFCTELICGSNWQLTPMVEEAVNKM